MCVCVCARRLVRTRGIMKDMSEEDEARLGNQKPFLVFVRVFNVWFCYVNDKRINHGPASPSRRSKLPN